MPKKIIFMGTPLFAVPILKSLYQNGYPISVIYTQPPQKSKRGQKINKSPVPSYLILILGFFEIKVFFINYYLSFFILKCVRLYSIITNIYKIKMNLFKFFLIL